MSVDTNSGKERCVEPKHKYKSGLIWRRPSSAHLSNRTTGRTDHFFSPPGAKLLQDYQAAHGPKEGEEEAAGAELPVLQVYPGVCVRHAPGLQKLRQVQRGEEHES